MLFVSTKQILSALPIGAEGVELRLDLFPQIDWQELQSYIASSFFPLLLTLRSRAHGGSFEGDRVSILPRLLALRPPLLDLEGDLPLSFFQRAIEQAGSTQLIASMHGSYPFEEREILYDRLSQTGAHFYKIAVSVNSSVEALQWLLWGQKDPRLSVIPMGKEGQFARVLSRVFGMPLQFASLNKGEETAFGQLSLEELTEIYRFPKLNSETFLYGLVGDPVDQSQGHFFHNRLFEAQGRNAVYVKMRVKKGEWGYFFPLAKEAGFRGLSVTMPLKREVLSSLDEMESSARAMGAVNTLSLQNGIWRGSNTDGKGALDAIEARGSVRGKTLVIWGAGGAASAVAFEGKARGARVIVAHRNQEKAIGLATALGCEAQSWEEISQCDILVNCTPEGRIRKTALAMDVVYAPKNTPFLLEAHRLGIEAVSGEEMFVNQAMAQSLLWNQK